MSSLRLFQGWSPVPWVFLYGKRSPALNPLLLAQCSDRIDPRCA
jgi:hypothetical protein